MIQDVYEPLARYRDEFRAKFAKLAADKFRELVEKSGVDAHANIALVTEIRRLEKSAEGAKSRMSLWMTLIVLAAAAIVGGLIAAYAIYNGYFACGGTGTAISLAVAAGAGLLLFFVFIPKWRAARDEHEALSRKIAEKKDEAWRQMAPLNALYDWDITPKLIEATVPRLAFDPFFTEGRLSELRRRFGWNDEFNDGKSMLFAQSGVINGNPFVFGEYREQTWGMKTYHGSLHIEWTEFEEDEKGRPRLVRRSETLRATVDKPIPEYGVDKLLVYGNDAAPDLSFTRRPAGLAELGDGFFDRMRKNSAMKKLEKFSRNLDDESQYTMMGNKEFETLFNTRDRNNEVQFRLLFTALAQTQLLALMKDRKVGFGDDFSFLKRNRINVILAKHLSEFPIDTDPSRFYDYDIRRAEATFRSFNEAYFKSVYFALAPLLCVPLYQQTRTPEDIWKDAGITPSSFWEHEALANWYGTSHFKAPDCITESILKTEVVGERDGRREVAVTASGFRGEKRVDYVSVHGGDGNWHDVPVEWVQYIPVSRTTRVNMRDCRGVSLPQFNGLGSVADRFRRSMVISCGG